MRCPYPRIIIRLSDDSPADGVGGAALFDDEIIIEDVDGNTFRGSAIGFEPIREGGFQRVGFLAADGGRAHYPHLRLYGPFVRRARSYDY